MALYFRCQNNHIVLSGDTYRYKEQIKALGGRYVSHSKSWIVASSSDRLASIADLCQNSGGGPLEGLGSPTPLSSTDSAASLLIKEAVSPVVAIEPPVASGSPGLTIAELMQEIHVCLSSRFSGPIWVIGELQNINLRPRAVFFNLAEPKEARSKDTSALSINANIWDNVLQGLKARHGRETVDTILQEGMKVRMLCNVSLYRDRGSISLNIIDVDSSFTKGALALAREQLIKELKQKGLYAKNKNVALTPFPFKVGLISAEGSRAKSDFLDQLLIYGFPGEVIFFPAQMQGENTPSEVTRGIQQLTRLNCNLIVITRGGGSAADLRWFDNSQIAYEIAGCPLPIIAAIGHHDDESVAEVICFQREKTPTAAADFILHIFQKNRERLTEISNLLHQKVMSRIEGAKQLLLTATSQLKHASNDNILRMTALTHGHQIALTNQYHSIIVGLTTRLSQLSAALTRGADAFLTSQKNRLNQASSDLKIAHEVFAKNAELGIKARLNALDRAASEQLGRIYPALVRLKSTLRATTDRRFEAFARLCQEYDSKISTCDPTPWITKGWTQLCSGGRTIRSIAEVQAGSEISARLHDGSLEMIIKDIRGKSRIKNEES
jgi:exodeoxyribonuclease VII large subunit